MPFNSDHLLVSSVSDASTLRVCVTTVGCVFNFNVVHVVRVFVAAIVVVISWREFVFTINFAFRHTRTHISHAPS